MIKFERGAQVWLYLLAAITCLSVAPMTWPGLLVPFLIVGLVMLRWAVDLVLTAPRPAPPAAEDFGQHEVELDHLRKVYKAAYWWRYAMATPGGDVSGTGQELIEAVDEWDLNRPHHDDGGPK